MIRKRRKGAGAQDRTRTPNTPGVSLLLRAGDKTERRLNPGSTVLHRKARRLEDLRVQDEAAFDTPGHFPRLEGLLAHDGKCGA